MKQEEDGSLVKILALFPAMAWELDFLKKAFNDDELAEKLDSLVKKDYLSKKETSYRMEEGVKKMLLETYATGYDEVSEVLENITSYINPQDSSLIGTKVTPYIPVIDEFLRLFEAQEDELMAKLLDSATYLYYFIGQHKKSLALQEKSFEIRKKIHGEASELTAINYDLLGNIVATQGNHKEAENLFLKALAIRKKELGEEHYATAMTYNNLAGLYESMRDYQNAEIFFLKALSITEQVLGEEHASTATAYHNIALFYKNQKQCLEAKKYLEKAIELIDKLEVTALSLLDLVRMLNEVEGSLKKEKKAKFKNKGRFCIS